MDEGFIKFTLYFMQAVDFSDYSKGLSCITDTRSVDELLTFINGEQDTEGRIKNKASSKAAKRQRQKQKKVNSNVFDDICATVFMRLWSRP
jgi:hypothetical protein